MNRFKDENECIFCPTLGVELHSPKDNDSFECIIKASKIRNDEKIISLKDKPLQDIFYHSDCRKKFVHRKTLQNIDLNLQGQSKQKVEKRPCDGVKKIPLKKQCIDSLATQILPNCCIFCSKDKYLPGTRNRESLCSSYELKSDRKVAIEKLDDKILNVCSVSNFPAIQAKYHKSCYKEYTRTEKDQNNTDKGKSNDEDDNCCINVAIKLACNQYRVEIMSRCEITDLHEIRKMAQEHIDKNLSETQVRYIRKKIRSDLDNEVDFILSPCKQKCYALPKHISKEQLFKEVLKLSETGPDPNFAVIGKCASQIRAEIKCMEPDKTWPPNPNLICDENINLPKTLQKFLYSLILPEKDVSLKGLIKLKAIAQDIIFTVSNGAVIPPKHMLLTRSVKTLTGNVELVKILNRFGHGISNTKLYELDTAFCRKKIKDTDGLLGIPAEILPGIPTHLAYDNIDRREETLDGSGTSHRVNGIIIQPRVPTVTQNQTSRSIKKVKTLKVQESDIQLPVYHPVRRTGPIVAQANVQDSGDVEKEGLYKNRLWILSRKNNVNADCEQSTPSWTGFNINTRDQDVKTDKIGYLPTINAPATSIVTVNAIMENALAICEYLELEEIAVCFDQSLYAKASEIKWGSPNKFSRIVITMGVFHTINTLMGIIGKRFQDSGLRDLAVEAGILSEGSVDQVLDGRHYNRGVRLHKLLYEALYRKLLESFPRWFEENFPNNIESFQTLLNEKLKQPLDAHGMRMLFVDSDFIEFNGYFEEYLMFLRNDNGDLSKYWMNYLDMVEILLGLIRASREGNWNLHLLMIEKMIPYCFAYDRINYSRYLPFYLSDMKRLQEEHPNLFHYFSELGGFSAQIGNQNSFGRIPIDQTIEETANKDTQTPGGTKGFSLQPNAVFKYYLSAEYRSIFLRNLRDMVDSHSTSIKHKDLTPARIKKDETDVNSLYNLIGSIWTDPFSRRNVLSSLSTGKTLPDTYRSDLLNADTKGLEAYKKFQERMIPGEVCKKIHEPIKKLSLKTFSETRKRKIVKTKNKVIELKADTALFGHMLLVAQSRNLHMKTVLSHTLGPIPFSIGKPDGELASTNKAEIAKPIESLAPSQTPLLENSATIIDGMPLVYRVSGKNLTFGQISKSIFQLALREGKHSKRIDVVFDVYKEDSIKTSERSKRGSSETFLVEEILPDQKIRHWDQILSSSKCKTRLIEFFFNDWRKPWFSQKLQDKSFLVTSGTKCVEICAKSNIECSRLECTQEEADSRLLLHAYDAAKYHDSVILVSRDTDVLIIALSVSNSIPNLYLNKSSSHLESYIDINGLATVLGEEVARALPGYHSYSGCDTVSCFVGKGKKVGFKLLKTDERVRECFGRLGESWDLSSDLFDELNRFTCLLYAPNTTCTSTNDLRYELFRLKNGKILSGQIPPCEDALRLHAERANFQAAIWRRCLEKSPEIPSPYGKGWLKKGNSIEIQWITGPPAPDAILEFLSCKCKKNCKLPTCQCMKNNLRCTAACILENCNNFGQNKEIAESDYDSD